MRGPRPVPIVAAPRLGLASGGVYPSVARVKTSCFSKEHSSKTHNVPNNNVSDNFCGLARSVVATRPAGLALASPG